MPRFSYVALIFLALLASATPGTGEEKDRRHKIGLVLGADMDRKLGDEVLSTVTDVFAASKRFNMIERHKLDAVFTEWDLKRFLGRGSQILSELLGLDLLGLVVHSVETHEGEDEQATARVTLHVRLVEVTTGVILETISSDRPYSPPALTLREAANYLSETLREKFPLSGYVVRVEGKEVIVDLGTDDGLKDGAALEVVRKGEQILHPVYSIPLPAEWIVTGELKVVFLSPQLSTCWLRWGEDVEPGSLVFLKEEFSPFTSLIEPKDKWSSTINSTVQCKAKERKSHVMDWLRDIFTRRPRRSCPAAEGAGLL